MSSLLLLFFFFLLIPQPPRSTLFPYTTLFRSDQVILRSTWNPAKEIQHEELGNLSVGSPADIAVLRLEKGKFGFLDQSHARFDGTQKLLCELTLRDGKVVYDLNGMARERWDKLPPDYEGGDPRWDGCAREQRRRPTVP